MYKSAKHTVVRLKIKRGVIKLRQNEQNNQSQVANLEKLLAEINKNPQINEPSQELPGNDVEIDVLNLPPRKNVHQSARRKLIINLKHPFYRFSIVIILIIAIVFFIYYIVGEQIIILFTTEIS